MGIMLEVRNIQCRYGDQNVVEDLSFSLNEGEICCLLGPSGSGKTTTLRAIAGLEPVYSGDIRLGARTISTSRDTLPPHLRNIGLVFQDYALFPHLTVEENIRFGLNHCSLSEQRERVEQLLSLVGLADLARRYPAELSGGQQQRIALVRTLAPTPKLILMDEPLSSIDSSFRRALTLEIKHILQSQGTTVLLVTHDQDAAFEIADKAGVIVKGKLQQWDTPYNLYHQPRNRAVAAMMGQGSYIPGRAIENNWVETEVGIIKGGKKYDWKTGTSLDVLLRPDDVLPGKEGHLKGKVMKKKFIGAATLYTLKLSSGSVLEAAFPSHHDHGVGELVTLRIEAKHLIAFPSLAQ